MAFPSSLPSYAGFTSSHTLSQDNHASQHNSEQADITAIATKMGTGASTPTSGTFLRSSGVGISSWSQVNLASSDVTGQLSSSNLNMVSVLKQVYPVGCIYTEITGTNPGTTFGFGTWVQYAQGETLVGFKSGDANFGVVEGTGGEATHLLTGAESGTSVHGHGVTDPGHQHALNGNVANRLYSPDFNNGTAAGNGSAVWGATAQSSATTGLTVNNSVAADASNAHNNLQPYITVYFWKRTA